MTLLLLAIPVFATTTRNITIYISGDQEYGDTIMDNLLADTTTQYDSRIIASGGVNNYTLSIYSRLPSVPKVQVTPTVVYLGASTETYVNSWANGVEYSRWQQIGVLNTYAPQCSSRLNFSVSTGTWNANECRAIMKTMKQDIYELGFSTPTIWVGQDGE